MAFPRNPEQWAYLLGALGVKPQTAATWAEAFAAECVPERFREPEREIDDYLAQVVQESSHLYATVESLRYSAPRIRELGARFGPKSRWFRAATDAARLAADAQETGGVALAEVLYGGRFGNDAPGDGWLYRGRGLPQITFKANYARVGAAIGLDLVANPDLLCDPATAVRASLAWWRGAVPLSAIDHDDRVRQCVNGSTLGLDVTRKLAADARAALGSLA